jgi:hypothetical protein
VVASLGFANFGVAPGLRFAAQYEQNRESAGIVRAQLGHLISFVTLRTVGDTGVLADAPAPGAGDDGAEPGRETSSCNWSCGLALA